MHLAGNGEFHAEAGCQFNSYRGGFYPFCDHRGGSQNVAEEKAVGQFQANLAIAAQVAGTGEDEVAQAGEAGHGFSAPPGSDGEAGEFGQTAGDEGGQGVVAEVEAITDAGTDGDDVLERASDFGPDRPSTANSGSPVSRLSTNR